MSTSYVFFVSVFFSAAVFPVSVSAVPASSTAEFSPLPSPCVPLGDVNGDGLVTAADAVFVNDVLLGVRVPTEAQRFEADVSNDGRISVTDSAEINAYLQGTAPSFSGCVPQAFALLRAQRDAQRLADLSVIQKALNRYAHDRGTYPLYSLLGTPASDNFWKNSSASDFKKRLKPYLYPLPVDPLNNSLENFRYVYATIPALNPPWGASCAGNTVLFATRVETSAAGHDECDLGDGEHHFTLIISANKTASSGDFFASALLSLWRLFSPAQTTRYIF
ncbi:MAG: Peptidase M15B and M15C DD-carboxypeptidase VanY/endolysin [Parcubacteria group bacterium GW2011_GWA2_49_9]|nr:MAG: Peptidase M15B and M15C DD-carboxypeptidase VanY/endolysin [Parcubacteria group bacterium GW2011_GWA2_49_9]